MISYRSKQYMQFVYLFVSANGELALTFCRAGIVEVSAGLPIDIRYSGIAVDDAAQLKQHIRQTVQVFLRSAKHLVYISQPAEPTFGAPAHRPRYVSKGGCPAAARQDEFLEGWQGSIERGHKFFQTGELGVRQRLPSGNAKLAT